MNVNQIKKTMEERKQEKLEEFKKEALMYYLGEKYGWKRVLEKFDEVYVRRIDEESDRFMEEGWDPQTMVQAMVACLV